MVGVYASKLWRSFRSKLLLPITAIKTHLNCVREKAVHIIRLARHKLGRPCDST